MAKKRWAWLAALLAYLTPSGKRVPVTDTKDGVLAVIAGVEQQLAEDAAAVAGGPVPAGWQAAREQTLAALHLATAAAAQGGLDAMDDAAYERVDATVAAQVDYLDGFVQDLPGLSGAMAAVRGAMYAASAFSTFMNTVKETVTGEGTVPGATAPDTAAERQLVEILARRVLDPGADHCDSCIDAAGDGWVPVDEVVDIGDSECGVRCLCDIEYATADEVNAAEEAAA